MLIYTAGPYSGDIDKNIAHAAEVAKKLWAEGFAVICPHMNTAHFDGAVTYDQFLSGDLEMVGRCDALYMLEGWQGSKGATIEHEFAKGRGIPIYYEPDPIPFHPTLKRCPVQAEAFLREVMNMYRVHLDKNADYSPANILGTGEIGLVTRIWDKVARLMNLSGFNIQIASSSFSQSKQPKHESIEDTLQDLSVYALIGKLLRRGEWGR